MSTTSTSIFICGMPGSGKSTLGARLAEYLNYSFNDLDDIIESQQERSIKDIFEGKGEDYFRLCEHMALKSFIADHENKTSAVLSLGGGTPCFHNNSELIKQHGVSIFLDTPLELIAERMLASDEISKRPLLADTGDRGIIEVLNNKYIQRFPYYEKSHIKIKGDESLEFISSLIESFAATRK